MIIKLAFISKSLLLSISLAVACLLTACYLFRWAFKPKPAVTSHVSTPETNISSVVESSNLDSTLNAPGNSYPTSLSRFTSPQPSSCSPSPPHHLDLLVDNSAVTAFAYNFWQFTADCIINNSKERRQTQKKLRNFDPDNLSILDKWAARDLFNFIPIRTQTQMMYAEDGKLITERPEGLPCSTQNTIIPMMCFSQQALCGFIFHLSEKKFYTVDPSHTYHNPETLGYFYDSNGRNIQAEIEQELGTLPNAYTTHTINLSAFTHIELSPKAILPFTEYAVYKFLCKAMCLALSYEFEDKTLITASQDFGKLLANTFTNTQESYYSRRLTLSHLQNNNSLFSSPIASNHVQYKAARQESEKKDTNWQDPRSVTFAASNEFCYPPTL